jgi:hypothetical protein
LLNRGFLSIMWILLFYLLWFFKSFLEGWLFNRSFINSWFIFFISWSMLFLFFWSFLFFGLLFLIFRLFLRFRFFFWFRLLFRFRLLFHLNGSCNSSSKWASHVCKGGYDFFA